MNTFANEITNMFGMIAANDASMKKKSMTSLQDAIKDLKPRIKRFRTP